MVAPDVVFCLSTHSCPPCGAWNADQHARGNSGFGLGSAMGSRSRTVGEGKTVRSGYFFVWFPGYKVALAAPALHLNFLHQCVSTGDDFAPRGQTSSNIWSQIVRTRDASDICGQGSGMLVKHSTVHRTACQNKELFTRSVVSAKAENPCLDQCFSSYLQ